MKRLTLLLLMFLAACSRPAVEVPLSDWGHFDLDRFQISLIDDKETQQLFFSKDGSVVATIGNKEFLAGPVFDWKLSNGKITIQGSKGDVYDELSLVSASEDRLTAIRKSGRTSHYQILSK